MEEDQKKLSAQLKTHEARLDALQLPPNALSAKLPDNKATLASSTIEEYDRLLHQDIDTKISAQFKLRDPQLERALNDWLGKMEVQVQAIEERCAAKLA